MNATLIHTLQFSRLRDMAAISSWTKYLPSFSGMELGNVTQSIGHWDFYKMSSVYRTVNNIKLLGPWWDSRVCSMNIWFCIFFSATSLSWTSLVAPAIKNLPAMRETQVQSLGREDPLEKAMATHSSILAWRIPWTEEPGRLQSTGLQRVRHDWTTSLSFTIINQ